MRRSLVLAGLLVSMVGGAWSLLLAGSSGSHHAGRVASTPKAAAARFEVPVGDGRAEAVAPIQLTASDGTGLRLVALEANGALEPPLAFTELHLTFENPRDARIEGRFRIALPPGAALSRFAMKGAGGDWQEGEVVERQRARLVYEDFLHRRQDPALLEQGAGNEFTARVFPIPAHGMKELIVAYSQELDATLPVQELKQSRFVPTADFVLEPKLIAQRAGLRSGNLVLTRVRPTSESHP